MVFKITSAKIVATPGSHAWTQAYEYTPENTDELANKGRLFILASAKFLEKEIDFMYLGREILSNVLKEYTEAVKKSPQSALVDTIKKVSSQFKNRVEGLELGAALVLGNALICVAYGGMRAYIIRRGSLATLLESSSATISASGFPHEDDVFILGTSSFFKAISLTDLNKACILGLEKAVEVFAPIIHSDLGSDASLYLIRFGEGVVSTNLATSGRPNFETLTRKQLLTGYGFNFNGIKKLISKKLKLAEKKNIYINGTSGVIRPQRSKFNLGIGIVLVIALLISILFGLKEKKGKEFREMIDSDIEKAEHLISESSNLYSIDKNRARDLFNEGKGVVLQLEGKGVIDERLIVLKNTIDSKEGEILGEYREDAREFLDITLLTSNFTGSVMSLSGVELYILDESGNKLVQVNIDKKGGKVIAGPSILEKSEDITSYSERIFVKRNDGVYQIDSSNKKKVIEKDWGDSAKIYAYAGNIYILDKSFSQIYRYNGSDSGFGQKKPWLTGQIGNLVNALDWTLDGFIWVLEEGGVVEKYSLGNKDYFSLEERFPTLSSPDAIYTDEEIESLYILDPEGEQIVVYDKEGKYIVRYLPGPIKDAKDLVVSEKERKAFFLQGGKLMFVELKHL